MWLFDDFEGGGEPIENVPSESYYSTKNQNARMMNSGGDKDYENGRETYFVGKDNIDDITNQTNCEVHQRNKKCENGESKVVDLIVNSSDVEVKEILELQKPADSLYSFSWKNIKDMNIIKQKIRIN